MRTHLRTLPARPLARPQAAVEVAHLKSYEGMGDAEVTCVSGCACDAALLNGTLGARVSLVLLQQVRVTQHPRCVLQVKVLPPATGRPAGATKVKVTGVMISDEAGSSFLHETFHAVDMAQEMAAAAAARRSSRSHHRRRALRLLLPPWG